MVRSDSNIQNEIRFVGSIYAKPELLVDYSYYIRSKYDFADNSARFFYDCADLMYKSFSEDFSKANIISFMSQDAERFRQFKQLGGYKTIESWWKVLSAHTDNDVRTCFDILKKYSLVREYRRKGYNVDYILGSKKFDTMSPLDVYKNIRGNVDKIHTKILGDSEIEVLNDKICDLIDDCIDIPSQGFDIPFPLLNELLMGMQKKTIMAVGALSNTGKSRLMIKLVAYATLILKKKTLVLLNEMTIDKMRKALLTTVINNPEYKALHGIDITKPEREIVMGMYRDREGNFIERKRDADGNSLETKEEFLKRVSENSDEYHKVRAVAKWIEEQNQGLIYVKDVSADYSDQVLEFEIRKAVLTRNVELWFYDTCKNEDVGQWSSFKITVSKLSELCKPLNTFGYLSMQLNDETNSIEPEDMNSSCIAEAKQTKHVLDSLVMIKPIRYDKYGYYTYTKRNDPEYGSDIEGCKLTPGKMYYGFVIDKNRSGERKKLLYEVDLNLNTWTELGEMKRT